MSLKECIKNRSLANMDLESYFHIPFRGSKLTLLLKAAFDLECHRHSKMVFFANISPSNMDVG